MKKKQISDIFRLFCRSAAVLLTVALSATPAVAEELPYQPYEVRQLCSVNGDPQVELFSDPGQKGGIFLPVGTEVVVDDVSFDDMGRGYYRADYPTGQGLERATAYILAEEAPNFCNYDARQQLTLNRFVAPPQHLPSDCRIATHDRRGQ